MTTNFPNTIDTLTNPTGTDKVATVDHAAQHANANDAIEALQAKVGVDSSAVTSSLDYIVKNPSSVSPGHKHVLNDNTDVDTTGAQDGDSLKYVASTGKFQPNATSTPDASTTVAGKSKLSVAPASATDPIAVGDNDTRVPSQSENDALAGTSGTPSSSNKYVTADDVTEAKTASKIVRRDSNADVLVATTPTNADAATSKTYVDARTSGAITSIVPMPAGGGVTVSTSESMGNNTTAWFGKFYLPASMTINKLSVNVSAATASDTLDIGIYSEDGQTKHFEITTATISGTGVVTTAVSSVTLPPGMYYTGVCKNGSGTHTLTTWTFAATTFSDVAGEDTFAGTKSISAGTLPTTFDPTALTDNNDAGAVIRLDN